MLHQRCAQSRTGVFGQRMILLVAEQEEVFHTLTVAAYVLQYIAVSFVVYRTGAA